MANPLLVRPDVLFAKLETTKGTPATITTSDGGFNVMNVVMKEDTTQTARPAQAGFGKLRGVANALAGSMTFDLMLEPGVSGAVPAWATTFFGSCGLVAASGVFTLTGDTSLQQCATFVHYKGAGASAIKQTLAGAMGSPKIKFANGQPHMVSFTYKGKYWEETTGTPLAPTLPTTLPPRGYQTLTVGGAALLAPECTYDFNTTQVLLEGPNDANATGYLHAIVGDFNPTFTSEPYQEALSVRDWRAAFLAGTEDALSIVVGVANPITLASAGIQLTSGPGFGNREQVHTRQLTWNDNKLPSLTFGM